MPTSCCPHYRACTDNLRHVRACGAVNEAICPDTIGTSLYQLQQRKRRRRPAKTFTSGPVPAPESALAAPALQQQKIKDKNKVKDKVKVKVKAEAEAKKTSNEKLCPRQAGKKGLAKGALEIKSSGAAWTDSEDKLLRKLVNNA